MSCVCPLSVCLSSLNHFHSMCLIPALSTLCVPPVTALFTGLLLRALSDQPHHSSIHLFIHPCTYSLSGLSVGRFHQHSAEVLDMEMSPVDYIQSKYQDKYPTNRLEEWRAVVGNYGIPKDYHLLPIKLLSDGLKTRLVFCEISLQNPHLLLFDEPTNAADMEVSSVVEWNSSDNHMILYGVVLSLRLHKCHDKSSYILFISSTFPWIVKSKSPTSHNSYFSLSASADD